MRATPLFVVQEKGGLGERRLGLLTVGARLERQRETPRSMSIAVLAPIPEQETVELLSHAKRGVGGSGVSRQLNINQSVILFPDLSLLQIFFLSILSFLGLSFVVHTSLFRVILLLASFSLYPRLHLPLVLFVFLFFLFHAVLRHLLILHHPSSSSPFLFPLPPSTFCSSPSSSPSLLAPPPHLPPPFHPLARRHFLPQPHATSSTSPSFSDFFTSSTTSSTSSSSSSSSHPSTPHLLPPCPRFRHPPPRLPPPRSNPTLADFADLVLVTPFFRIGHTLLATPESAVISTISCTSPTSSTSSTSSSFLVAHKASN